MFAPGTFKLLEYPKEVRKRYCIFDDCGCIIGVKDDAPPDIKEAYEADKKISDEWATLGID